MAKKKAKKKRLGKRGPKQGLDQMKARPLTKKQAAASAAIKDRPFRGADVNSNYSKRTRRQAARRGAGTRYAAFGGTSSSTRSTKRKVNRILGEGDTG